MAIAVRLKEEEMGRLNERGDYKDSAKELFIDACPTSKSVKIIIETKDGNRGGGNCWCRFVGRYSLRTHALLGDRPGTKRG